MSKEQLEKSEKLAFIIASLILCGLLVTSIRHLILQYSDVAVSELHRHSFINYLPDQFSDLFGLRRCIVDFKNPYEVTFFNYFPFNIAFTKLLFFYQSYHSALIEYLIISPIAAFLLAFVMLPKYTLEKKLILTLFFSILNYPFLFAIDRGNLEIFIFLGVGLFFYFRHHNWHKTSIFFLSFSIAIKMFPAVLLLLPLSEKRYKDVGLAILLTLIFSFAGVFSVNVNPIEIWNGLNTNLWHYKYNYIYDDWGLAWGHSLWGGVKIIVRYLIPVTHPKSHKLFMALFVPYKVFSVVVLLFSSVYVFFSKSPYWKKAGCLIIYYLLIWPVSADYKLLHLLLFAFLFLQSEEKRSTSDMFYAVGIGLLLMPKHYFYFYDEMSISILISPIILLGMAFPIWKEGMELLLKIYREKRILTSLKLLLPAKV